MSKQRRAYIQRDEAFEARQKTRWKTCPFCGTFCKKGVRPKHVESCGRKFYERKQLEAA